MLKSEQVCTVDGCERPQRTRDWCGAHYTQWFTTREIPTRPFTPEARFYKYVDKRGADECWLWLSTVKKNGYGQFWLNGQPARAHRVSYELSNGPIPDGLLIRHTCDTKMCVNPGHLITGTPADNSRDAVERGLTPRGTDNGNSKLDLKQVEEIRARRADGEAMTSIARRFGVVPSTIQWIIYGKNWAGQGNVS